MFWKKLRVICACLLILSILVFSNGFSFAAYANYSITNVSFENLSGSSLADWGTGGSATFSSDTTVKFDGKRSAKIVCSDTSKNYVIQKWGITVSADQLYQAGLYTRTDLTSGSPKLSLYFYNSLGTLIKTVAFSGGGGRHSWEYMGGLVKVPSNAVSMGYSIEVGSCAGSLWFDAAELIQSSQKMTNSDFETWSSGVPQGWTGANGSGSNAVLSQCTNLFYNGSNCAKIVCGSPNGDSYYLHQWYIPVLQGDAYEFNVYYLKAYGWSGGTPQLKVYFYDSSYTYIGQSVSFNASGPVETWNYLGGKTLVPNNAAYATIELTTNAGKGTIYWDTASMGRIIHPPVNLGVVNRSAGIFGAAHIGNGKFLAGAFSSALDGCGQAAVVDDKTGQVSTTADLPGSSGCWSMITGLDGKIYIGTFTTNAGSGQSAAIYRMDPQNLSQAPVLVATVSGEMYSYSLSKGYKGGKQGIYFGTYGHGKLMFLSTDSSNYGTLTDIGTVDSTQKSDGSLKYPYVRSVVVAPNNLVYCGLGDSAGLKVYNPSNGTFTNVLPSTYSTWTWVYDMQLMNGKVYAQVSSATQTKTLIFDPANLGGQPVEAAAVMGCAVAYDSLQPNKYYVLSSAGIIDYNTTTNTYTKIGDVSESQWIIAMTYGELNKTGYPGKSLIGITSENKIWHYSPTTQQQEFIDFKINGYGMGVMSVQALGSKVYVGTGQLNLLSYYDTVTNNMVELGKPVNNGGEIYSMGVYNNKLYMGSYTEAILSVYDPSQAWNPGTTAGSNPRKIGKLDSSQYRPYCCAVGENNKIYFGSQANYGLYGGALSVLDPATDSISMLYRLPTDVDEAISALSYIPGQSKLIGGTIRVNSNQTVTGRVFIWDIPTNSITWLTSYPVRGAVTSIRVLSNGDAYIASKSGYVDVYNLASGWKANLQLNDNGNYSVEALAIGKDNHIYAAGKTIFARINSKTLTSETLFNEGTGPEDIWYNPISVDSNGNIYFANGCTLRVFHPLDAPAMNDF